jgi:hypothetical protein
MLSAEERRRLDEIERLLQLHDPEFVYRMRGVSAPPRRARGRTVAQVLLWSLVGVLWLAAGWQVGVVAAALAGFAVLIALAYRRGRRRRLAFGTPADPPHWFGAPPF